MKPNFPIFLAAALLLGVVSAEAAHHKAPRNNPSHLPRASSEAAHHKAAPNSPPPTASSEAAPEKSAPNSPPPTASSVPTSNTNPTGGIGTGQSFPPISSAPL